MLKPHITAFVGTVGAGKSTQMTLLASKLKIEGLKVNVTFLKTGHGLAYLLEVLLAGILIGKRKDVSPIRALIEKRTILLRRLFKLWLALDVLSISVRFLLTLYLPMKMRRMIIVEDYVPATISDYIYLAKAIGSPPKSIIFATNFILRMSSMSCLKQVIFLDATDAVLKNRWRLRGTADEFPDYLHMQRTVLLSLSMKLSSLKFLYINTDKLTVEETHKLIVNHLEGL